MCSFFIELSQTRQTLLLITNVAFTWSIATSCFCIHYQEIIFLSELFDLNQLLKKEFKTFQRSEQIKLKNFEFCYTFAIWFFLLLLLFGMSIKIKSNLNLKSVEASAADTSSEMFINCWKILNHKSSKSSTQISFKGNKTRFHFFSYFFKSLSTLFLCNC